MPQGSKALDIAFETGQASESHLVSASVIFCGKAVVFCLAPLPAHATEAKTAGAGHETLLADRGKVQNLAFFKQLWSLDDFFSLTN